MINPWISQIKSIAYLLLYFVAKVSYMKRKAQEILYKN